MNLISMTLAIKSWSYQHCHPPFFQIIIFIINFISLAIFATFPLGFFSFDLTIPNFLA